MRISEYNMGCHVPQESIGPELGSCPMCGGVYSLEIFSIQESPIVKLNKCTDCKIVYANHHPLHDFLMTYYSYYYKGHNGDGNVTTDSVKRFANHITRLVLMKYIGDSPKSFKVLDYGGGDGSIGAKVAKIIGKKKSTVTSIDVFENESSIEGLEKLDGCKYLYDANNLENDYDLIIASGVLEHVKNPFEVLTLMINHLAPGGVIYIRTPYVLPVHRLLSFFGFKQDFGYPAHFFDFSPQSWEKILLLIRGVSQSMQFVYSGASPSEVGIMKRPVLGLITAILKMPTRLGFKNWPFCGGYEVLIRKNLEA